MTRFYDIDEANEALPDVERILLDLRDQRAELIRLRDAVLAASKRDGGERGGGEAPPATSGDDPDARDAEAAAARRLMRLRMQGLIDQMQAGVTRLRERGGTLGRGGGGPLH